MNTASAASEWKVPKWPFLAGDGLLLAIAGYIATEARHPLGLWEGVVCAVCVVVGALLGVAPFVMEYRATGKLIEVNGLGTVAEKIQQVDHLAAQIAACTESWTHAQTLAEKTAVGAKETSDRMSAEVRQFVEFAQRLNDSEKSSLRLEVDKLRRNELDWLQALARILDNVFILHTAAVRSSQPQLAAELGQFQNDCHDAARRVGLAVFLAEPNEAFNGERHKALGAAEAPAADAVVGETVRPGFRFQGKIIRAALVRLKSAVPAKAEPTPEEPAESDPQMTLETPD